MESELVLFRNEICCNGSIIFLKQKTVCNKFFLEELEKKYRVLSYRYRVLLRFFEKLVPRVYKKRMDRQTVHRNLASAMHVRQSTIAPKFEELRKIELWEILKREASFVQGKPIVALAVRDKAHVEGKFTKQELESEEYRYTPFPYFRDSIKWLIDQGCQVVRIGRQSNRYPEEDCFDHSFLDYSKRPDIQSDEMDFFLASVSWFGISTGTGVDEILALYRKKICFVNVSPPNIITRSILYPASLTADYYDQDDIRLNGDEVIRITRERTQSTLKPPQGIQVKPKDKDQITRFIKEFYLAEKNQTQFSSCTSFSMLGIPGIYY